MTYCAVKQNSLPSDEGRLYFLSCNRTWRLREVESYYILLYAVNQAFGKELKKS